MRSRILLCAVFVWNSFAVLVSCSPINVGVLHSSYGQWIEVIQQYGHLNGSTRIETAIINGSETFRLEDMDNALTVIKQINAVAVVGDYDQLMAAVTDYLRIPYFITSLVPSQQLPSQFHIRMIPDITTYTSAIRDLFKHYSWTNIGVLYDTDYGSEVVALIMEHLAYQRDLFNVRSYNVRQNSSADVVRWALKDLRRNLFTNFLIICSPETSDIVLTQALYLSLLSRSNSWLVVNMGSGDIRLDKFIDSRANMTLIRLMVDPLSPQCALNESDISLTKAVYYDVFRIINGTTSVKPTDSDKERVSRAEMRKQMNINGCTGNLNFTKMGIRNETFLQMLALEGIYDGAGFNALWESISQSPLEDFRPWLIRLSGLWRSDRHTYLDRVQPSKSYSHILNEREDIFADKVLRVTVTIEEPFVQWRNKTEQEGLKMGNDKFEGFCIDILEEIAKLLKFKYNISRVPDGKFGSLKPPPRYWTGMVRQLVDDKADIALAPFSITPERSSVVDFTKPFMTKGTSVVVKKPERSVWPFQFLSPLSKVVWIAIFLSYVFVGLFLFGVTRISSDTKQDFKTDLRESFWYVWGTLLRADLSGSPIATSGRIISATWWFFSLIIISIYTANLAAFLTISNAHIPISSAADLANQAIYNYGTVDGSQIENFFEHTNISHYSKMMTHMISPKSKVRRVENGFDRVLQEKYAFIWDSPTVRHATANNCDLMEIGRPFDLKGYGIATQKHSMYSEKLSMAVLGLNDNGILYRLEGKWWRRPNCPDPRSNAKSKEIEIEVASGMFIVLLCGILLSAVVCVVQYIVKKKCKKCRDHCESRDPDIQTNHNHVTTNFDDHVDEATAVLSRTLSIGENCINSNRWENRHACCNSSNT